MMLLGIFETIKNNISAKQAAVRYGLKVNRNGMARCPFHADKVPSLKIDERYYCFGCGTTGDAVDLTAKLLNSTRREAIHQLENDFNFNNTNRRKGIHNPVSREKQKSEISALRDYRCLLNFWEREYAPRNPEEEWHPLFCAALQQKDYIDYLLDEKAMGEASMIQKAKLNGRKEVEK